ncbi:MAG: glycosyltransferase family 9 protein [Flavobacteriales bacterium]|nr:glycosyltransferase family 9 protein [Flavobacteriales bacterium]
MTKFLVIRFSSIGDIVLASPVFRHLKEQVYEGAEVHFLTKEAFAPVVEADPYIDKVYTIRESTHEVREAILDENYDYIIDLHRNVRSRMIKKKTKALSFTLEKYNWEKWLWVNFNKNKMPQKHIVDRYLDTILRFDIKNDGKGLHYFIPEKEKLNINGLLPGIQDNGFIAWAISAAHDGKKMSKDKLMELLPKVDHPIVLIGGPEDKSIGQELADKIGHVNTLIGKLSLHGSASVIDQAKLVVSPDTGMMHIAAALNKNVVSYWGCTHPGLGMYPYLPENKFAIVMPSGGRVRPCSKLGNRCRYGNNKKCPDLIEDLDIVSKTEYFWKA